MPLYSNPASCLKENAAMIAHEYFLLGVNNSLSGLHASVPVCLSLGYEARV